MTTGDELRAAANNSRSQVVGLRNNAAALRRQAEGLESTARNLKDPNARNDMFNQVSAWRLQADEMDATAAKLEGEAGDLLNKAKVADDTQQRIQMENKKLDDNLRR